MIKIINRFKTSLLNILSIFLLFIIWEIAALVIKNSNPNFANNIFPTLEYICTNSLKGISSFATKNLISEIHSSYYLAIIVLLQNSLFTLARLLSGTITGIILGVLSGLILGRSRIIRKMFLPLVQTIRTIPLLALIPLFLVWFGGAEIGNILFITFGIFILMVIYTINAIENVPPIYAKFAQTLGASKNQIYRTVVVPAIIPELTGGVRVSFGVAWGITLGAEYLAAQEGLGRMLIWAQIYMFAGRMFIIVMLFMIYAYILNKYVLKLRRNLLKWTPDS